MNGTTTFANAACHLASKLGGRGKDLEANELLNSLVSGAPTYREKPSNSQDAQWADNGWDNSHYCCLHFETMPVPSPISLSSLVISASY
jgi:hypothetical protein